MKRIALLLLALGAAACGSSSGSPASPSSTSGSGPSSGGTGPVTFTLSGHVNSPGTGPLNGATVTVLDGPNAGKNATTASTGLYMIKGLAPAGFTVRVDAMNFVSEARPVALSNDVVLDVAMLPTAMYGRSGVGNVTLTLPTYVTKLRIVGTWNGASLTRFLVTSGGQVILDHMLGPAANLTVDDGVYAIPGGTLTISNSPLITWKITEVRG